MGQVFLNGKPLTDEDAEVFLNSANSEPDKSQVGADNRKFVMVHSHHELHITACAASKMADVDGLPSVDGYEDYFTEPNAKWLKNPADEHAWVKVYLSPKSTKYNSVINGRAQTVTIPMEFLGENVNECWGELQFLIKQTIVRSGKLVKLELVKLGRHRSYDPRIGQWVSETKPIEPKTKKDYDNRPSTQGHYYISLRFFHQDHRPEKPADWRFEPVYISVAGEDFYRIDVVWQDKEIVITATLLDDDSDEIPTFLRRQ